MKKKLLVAAFCAAMSVALCACNTTKPVDTDREATAAPTGVTPEATATPSALAQAYENLPVTNYEDYVESTVLPEGYVGFEIDAITDADVDAYVQEVLANNKERVLKDGAIEETDIAIIDYIGYLNGVAFEGGTAYSHEMEIGNSGFVDGFDDGLIGAKKGDTVMLNVTFPEAYENTELAGQKVVFEVTIHSVAAQVPPEFTDDFVKELTDGAYTTTEEFCLYAKGYLTEERKYTEIMDYLVENTTFGKMHEDYIDASLKLEKEYYALMYGFADVEELETYFGADNSEVLWAMLKKQIVRYEQDRIVLYCVAKANDITQTEEEYNQVVVEYAQSLEMTLEELYATQDETQLRQSMLMEKALEFLLDSIVVKGAEE